ncbi:Uu.00g012480.m01.CDS01 [Anthostomella pinea]|uniref:Uu.00g012480.m01.CDS01 n=1 Tax=Anthostomella pinea TaxID=933095 RepID=A0AAI8YQ37_9PEZI|nr:Uu.00g012480.m01.CDS01 [Anthostomella pinea]
MANPTFTLSRATLQDIPTLAAIAALAFKNDTNTQLKAAAQPPGAFEAGMAGMAGGLRQWIQTPERCAVLKAVNDRNNTIVGSVQWGFRGVPVGRTHVAEVLTGPANDVVADEEVLDGGEHSRLSPEKQQIQTEPTARIKALETMTSAHLAAFQRRIMPDDNNTQCMYIGGVTVDPAYQAQGVGTQLVRWGTEQADRAGVFCWVCSSEGGWGMFERLGFREVERLTVGLDEWAVGPPPSGKGEGEEEGEGDGDGTGDGTARGRWGEYTFRYMVRQPRDT